MPSKKRASITTPEAPSYKKPDPVGARFGRRLRDLRTEREWTQSHLAVMSGLDRSFISDMERGVKEPTISTLDLLASVFKLPLAELMKGV